MSRSVYSSQPQNTKAGNPKLTKGSAAGLERAVLGRILALTFDVGPGCSNSQVRTVLRVTLLFTDVVSCTDYDERQCCALNHGRESVDDWSVGKSVAVFVLVSCSMVACANDNYHVFLHQGLHIVLLEVQVDIKIVGVNYVTIEALEAFRRFEMEDTATNTSYNREQRSTDTVPFALQGINIIERHTWISRTEGHGDDRFPFALGMRVEIFPDNIECFRSLGDVVSRQLDNNKCCSFGGTIELADSLRSSACAVTVVVRQLFIIFLSFFLREGTLKNLYLLWKEFLNSFSAHVANFCIPKETHSFVEQCHTDLDVVDVNA